MNGLFDLGLQVLFISVAAGLLIFFIIIAIVAAVNRERNLLQKRISGFLEREDQTQPVHSKKEKRSRIKVSKAFAEQLLSAGIRMRPEEFMSFWIMCSVLPAMFTTLAGGHPITVTALVAVGVFIPPVLVMRSKAKRIALFERQLGDALMLMGNCLHSGLAFLQAMSNIAKDMPEPISREFSRAVREIQLGSSMDEALQKMVQRVPSCDLMLLVSAVQIQRQSGGNLMQILENISATIKERLKLKDEIRVMTSSGRTSSVIIGMLPILIALVLMFINPGYIQTFFQTSMGIGMLVIAAIMEAVGFIFINKMVTVKY